MNNEEYWYNLKEDNGTVIIEKKLKKVDVVEPIQNDQYYEVPPKKSNWKPVAIVLPILIILPLLVLFLFGLTFGKSSGGYKYRTFMMYMVGSDLESDGSIATYDLNDIVGRNIDLDNTNVILMVGGSKKWHNFVKEDEVAIYELTNSGFKKVKSSSPVSMGASFTLSSFIDYVHSNYESEKYDMIFWNHGFGAAGLEHDEVSDDFINIVELDEVFAASPFKDDNKLEVVIFNNCLSGNVHFASVMKNYAEYMVASEEVMYVGSIIDRLNFLNEVDKDDDGYDIGLAYIQKSDESLKKVNKLGNDFDSTLSIIDLSKVDQLEKNINEYFDSIDLDNNYRLISIARRKTHTYGTGDNVIYDTVDLYELTEALQLFSDSEKTEALQDSIKDVVKYNSAFNDYSNGLSIYFPYYGNTEYITSHLYLFEKLWNNSYVNFINSYYSLSNSAKRANRAGTDDEVLLLKNNIISENDTVKIELTDEEKDAYQKANIDVLEKVNDEYQLLLKSDELYLDNNILVFDKFKILQTSNSKIISSVYSNGMYKVYGKYNDSNVIVNIENQNGEGIIKSVLVDSGDKPIGGIVDYNDETISFNKVKYNILENNKIVENWQESMEKDLIDNKNNDVMVVGSSLNNHYVLIELFDVNNDVFYSQLTEVK